MHAATTGAREPARGRDVTPAPDRYQALADELDAIKRRALAKVGEEDVDYVRRLDRFSHGMEVIGRGLLYVSFEPLTFFAGVGALWIHKQLQATEIGHTVLHGVYDRLPGAEAYQSKTYRWDIPIDEESWRYGHNVRHHGNTNIAGKDADIHFGRVRLTKETAHVERPIWMLGVDVFVTFTNFAFVMNTHFTGLNDVFVPGDRLDFLPDRSEASVREAWRKALRKYVPYYAVNYGLFPALAGPFFWKVLLGNWLAETTRDVYSACTIWCGHAGADVKSWPEGTKARSRGEWYAMQIEAANDFEVPLPVSILCGGLDKQIEHHLFPTLAPQRLREIAPEVRAACERSGVPYKSNTWGKTLTNALRHVTKLWRGREDQPHQAEVEPALA